MIETFSVAFAQSSGERRSPATSSTIRPGIESGDRLLQARELTRRPDETTKLTKAVFQKDFDDLRADKPAGSSHQNEIIWRNYVVRIHFFEDDCLSAFC